MPKRTWHPDTTLDAGSRGHRDRLKARFLTDGFLGMPEEQLLELLLTYAIPRRDVRPLAEELIKRFGGLRAVFAASILELTEIRGIGAHTATLIRLAGELVARGLENTRVPAELVKDSRQLQRFLLARFSGLQEEKHLVIFLDSHGTVLGEEFMGAGTVDEVVVFPREVVRNAVRYNAHSLILAHNHLHGPPIPSLSDREQAERLKEILLPLDMVVEDSVVVGQNRCFSVFRNAPL